MTYASVRRSSKKRAKVFLGIDVPLLLVVISLLAFGLVMVYSASWDFSWWVYDSPTYIFSRQLLWLAIGVSVMVATTLMALVRTGGGVYSFRSLSVVRISGVKITSSTPFVGLSAFCQRMSTTSSFNRSRSLQLLSVISNSPSPKLETHLKR